MQRRKLPLEPGSRDLVQMDRPVEVLQPLLAEVAQLDARGLLLFVRAGCASSARGGSGLHVHWRRCARHDGRPGRGSCRGRGRLTGVDSHAHAHVPSLWPVVLSERALRLDRRQQRVAGATEGDEERVALRVNDAAAVAVECLPQQPLVLGNHLAVAVAQLLEQASRSFDVCEQEGDRAA